MTAPSQPASYWWEPQAMDRRSFLKAFAGAGGLAAAGSFPAPAISQGAAKVLRFVPQADLDLAD